MNFKYLLKTNVFLLVAYLASYFLNSLYNDFFFLKAISGILIILLAGLNSAIILKIISKKDFDFVEILNISFLGIIIFIPFVLLVENEILDRTYQSQSFVTVAIIALLVSIISFLKKSTNTYQLFKFPQITIKKIITSPLTWAIFLEIFVIISTVFLYKFLPDKDPFTWHTRLVQYFGGDMFSKVSYRLLFYYTYFLFNNLTGIDAFIFLKYIIPFLFLAVFLPIWMAIRKIDDPKKQIMILLIPFLAPNTILFSLMGMPQAFFIILLYYFVFSLFYSHLSRDRFYYYLAGIIALGATLYYEAGIIILVIWILFTIFYERKTIISNKKDVFFVFILIISNISIIDKYANFVTKWIKEITSSFVHPHFNFIFPLEYNSIDGIKIGTQSILGAIKSYLGYAGPVIILFVLIAFYLMIKNRINIRKYWNFLKKSREFQITFVLFAIFFIIAEILPRFPGIALLPGRAWIFASIFFSFFLMLFISKNSEHYISKKYIIPMFFVYS